MTSKPHLFLLFVVSVPISLMTGCSSSSKELAELRQPVKEVSLRTEMSLKRFGAQQPLVITLQETKQDTDEVKNLGLAIQSRSGSRIQAEARLIGAYTQAASNVLNKEIEALKTLGGMSRDRPSGPQAIEITIKLPETRAGIAELEKAAAAIRHMFSEDVVLAKARIETAAAGVRKVHTYFLENYCMDANRCK